MVRIAQPPGPGKPQVVVTVEAPMASLQTLKVVIQNTNQAQPLPSHPCRQATLHALSSNAGTVYMGNSAVNADSFPLNPGAAQDVHVDDLKKVYVFGTKNDSVSVEVEWGIGAVE